MEKLDNLIQAKTEYITSLYREIESELLYSIVELIVSKGYTPTARLKLEKLLELNNLELNEEILKIISKITDTPLTELQKAIPMISDISVDISELNKAYELGLVLHKPSAVNLETILQSKLSQLNKDIGLVQTSIREYAYKDVKRVVDKMVLETQLGTMSADEAMVKAIKELSRKGITGSTYLREGNEVTVPLETTLNRIIRTEFVQLANEVNEKYIEELEVEHIITSQHLGARNKGKGYDNHEAWQGKVYRKDEMEEELGYGEITGLGGINCRHIHFPFIEGVSTIPKRIDTEENERVYLLQQTQRRYERSIRQSKRTINALERIPSEEAGLEIAKEKKLLRQRQARLRRLIKDNSDVLKRYREREKVIA